MAESSAEADEPEHQGFEVMPDNWPAWLLFVRCATQWRVAPMGGYIGLDYAAVDLVAKLGGVRRQRERFELLDDLRMIEAGALGEFERQRARKHGS